MLETYGEGIDFFGFGGLRKHFASAGILNDCLEQASRRNILCMDCKINRFVEWINTILIDKFYTQRSSLRRFNPGGAGIGNSSIGFCQMIFCNMNSAGDGRNFQCNSVLPRIQLNCLIDRCICLAVQVLETDSKFGTACLLCSNAEYKHVIFLPERLKFCFRSHIRKPADCFHKRQVHIFPIGKILAGI